jgi:hypothetical protein
VWIVIKLAVTTRRPGKTVRIMQKISPAWKAFFADRGAGKILQSSRREGAKNAKAVAVLGDGTLRVG